MESLLLEGLFSWIKILAAFMGNCLGSLTEPISSSDRTLSLSSSTRKKEDQSLTSHKRLWSSSTREMENDISNFRSFDTHHSSGLTAVPEEANGIVRNHSFINEAAISWHEMRREWVGDKSKRSRKRPKEPSISWSTMYDDLLSSTHPFPQPIPLSEMVDFLVDIWHEEGLYE